MPEGDTIHRTAARLRPALEGAAVVQFRAPRVAGRVPAPGTRVDGVESRGKHLLVHFEGGLSLRTHLKMSGSWHLYRSGERWKQPAHLARAVIEVDSGWVAVCFSAPVVELYHRGAPPSALATLGPDLCDASVDIGAVLARLDTVVDDDVEIADVLLDQRVAAGIGNVYKSEVLWTHGVHPFVPLRSIDRSLRRRLFDTAGKLLRANLGSGPRTTHPAGLAVYGRGGRPCRRCGSPIRSRRQGELARLTYWCPSCQPAPA